MTEPGKDDPTGRSHLNADTLRKVASRDPEALNIFFDHYFDRVYTLATYLTGDPVLAEDLAQESFIRLHRAIERLDPERDPGGWIFTVVMNTVRDYWRSKQHRRATREVDIEMLKDTALESQRPTPDQDVERRQAEVAVREALLSLAEPDRQVLLLRTYEELATDDIAQILGITPEAVRQRHSRAVGRLGKAFKERTRPERIGD